MIACNNQYLVKNMKTKGKRIMKTKIHNDIPSPFLQMNQSSLGNLAQVHQIATVALNDIFRLLFQRINFNYTVLLNINT